MKVLWVNVTGQEKENSQVLNYSSRLAGSKAAQKGQIGRTLCYGLFNQHWNTFLEKMRQEDVFINPDFTDIWRTQSNPEYEVVLS